MYFSNWGQNEIVCLSNREIFSTHLVRLPQKNQMNTNQNKVLYTQSMQNYL